MLYHSTRNPDLHVSFQTTLVAGLAADGGLFVPDSLPKLDSASLNRITAGGFPAALALSWQVFAEPHFGAGFFAPRLTSALKHFPIDDPLPLHSFGAGHFGLDLTQGPTLSFKDIAMQCLGNILPDLIPNERRIVLGATSGDTGPAALFGFKDQPQFDVVFLYPADGVSDFQRRQMTTLDNPNLHAVAIKGDFDTCQALVKSAFTANSSTSTLPLMAVNSINWGRIVAQIAYYIHAAQRLVTDLQPSAGVVDVSVPTGNFGNAYAAYLARLMEAPIGRIILACNRNDTLIRCIQTGHLHHLAVTPTITPSMDVQIASNFERYLATNLEPEDLRSYLDHQTTESIVLPAYAQKKLQKDFVAETITENDTLSTITSVWHKCKKLIDPHSAVAYAAAEKNRQQDVPMLTVMTASPSKFQDTVFNTTGVTPSIPSPWDDLASRDESRIVLAPNVDALLGFLKALPQVTTRD